MTNTCCEKNVPPLDNTRQPGSEWQCPDCKKQWVWDDDEAEGGAWYPVTPTEHRVVVRYGSSDLELPVPRLIDALIEDGYLLLVQEVDDQKMYAYFPEGWYENENGCPNDEP